MEGLAPIIVKKPKTNDERIAEQVAVKSLTELMAAKVEVPKDLRYALWWWNRNALKDYIGVQMGNPIEEIEK